jgi:hypothetical protein
MTITVDEKRIFEELVIAQQEDIGLKSIIFGVLAPRTEVRGN